jgi:hypothetical protein
MNLVCIAGENKSNCCHDRLCSVREKEVENTFLTSGNKKAMT